jgi:glycosyltransferase involved in cell wall biosynthesis
VDVVHLHVQWLSVTSPLLRLLGRPTVLTLHADIGGSLIPQVVKRFNVRLIAVSYAQKRRMEARGFNVHDVVYHGIEVKRYSFLREKDDYLVYLGRIDHSKGTHVAVRVAREAGESLVIIGPIADKEYFKRYVEPYIDDHNIMYVGEVDFNTKVKYLSMAKAMLYPVQYEEFFGIAMVEALACGTPVIGSARGSVSEIVKHSVTGYLVNNEDEMINAIKNVDKLSPNECRRDAEERFSASKMAEKYKEIYEKLLSTK